jgi:hypothetical protein
MDYQFSFTKRMLLMLACAQLLLLAACFALGVMAGRRTQGAAAPSLKPAPAASDIASAQEITVKKDTKGE